MDYQALANEIKNDPTSLGYAGKRPEQIVAILNEPRVSIQVNRGNITGEDLAGAIDLAEWSAATAAHRDYIRMLVSAQAVKLSNPVVLANLGTIFNAQSKTRANVLRRAGSRAEELFGGPVTLDDVMRAN